MSQNSPTLLPSRETDASPSCLSEIRRLCRGLRLVGKKKCIFSLPFQKNFLSLPCTFHSTLHFIGIKGWPKPEWRMVNDYGSLMTRGAVGQIRYYY